MRCGRRSTAGRARQRPRPRRGRRPLQGAAGHRMSAPGTLQDIRNAVRSGERSAVDVCADALARISRAEPSLHAFNTVAGEQALARAAVIDRDRAAWKDAPLLGVPIALKDNMCTRGVRTTAALANSRQLRPAVRRYGRVAPRAGRRGPRRQDQLRRVLDGVVHGELRVWPIAQSVGDRSHSRRVERRFGRGRGLARRAARIRVRHGRIDPSAGRHVRRRRHETNVRSRVALRPDRIRVVARSDRAAHAHRARCRARARRDCRRRSV